MMSFSPAREEGHGRHVLGRRWRRRARGFRLCARRHRFSVRRLRAKLLTFLGLVGRHARRLARRFSSSSSTGGGGCSRSSSARALVGRSGSQRWCSSGETANKAPGMMAASFMRTNSFYAQAIADCLEFIKRSSVPLEDYGSPVVVAGGARR